MPLLLTSSTNLSWVQFHHLGVWAFPFFLRYPCSNVVSSTELKLIPKPGMDAFTPEGKLTAHTSHFALQNPILSPVTMSTDEAPAPRQYQR